MGIGHLVVLPITIDLFASQSIAAAGQFAPPAGEYYDDYGFDRGQVFGPGRGFFLMPEGYFRALDEDVSSYSYDATTNTIFFSGGFGELNGGSFNRIDIAPQYSVYTFCIVE